MGTTLDFALSPCRITAPMDVEVSKTEKRELSPPYGVANGLDEVISRASGLQLSYQMPKGYWWYTLEANEAIGAEFIILMRFLDCVDADVEEGVIRRILSEQRPDGSWSLYYNDEGDLNITIECYFVLKMAGHNVNAEYMKAARKYILAHGGITKSRVFTRIHLAMFGLVPWSICPSMPIQLILLPSWMPVNIYEFSSWARACIIPLLVIMDKKLVRNLKNDFNLEELYAEAPDKRDFQFKHNKASLSWENFFIQFDKWLKLLTRVPLKPVKNQALRACKKWIVEHIAKTEDIYPAMAYSAIAMYALGYPLSHPTIKKCLGGLKRFRQCYEAGLPALPDISAPKHPNTSAPAIHQQCCISPVWDTPWTLTALLDSGVSPDDPRLLKAGRWLISKQITEDVGDWKVKNPYGRSGGWSFEFENIYFPDVDDTIQVLDVLNRLAIPSEEKQEAVNRGLSWLLSMQNDDGGWAAFDKNNDLELVNKIPFSDHGACLDPSSPDITARVIAMLSRFGYPKDEEVVKKALSYLYDTQSPFGGWFGRWGINYIYGTWCVLTAMEAIGEDMGRREIRDAVKWLKNIQREDGGWSESPKSYALRKYVPYPESVPSQTAWALMGLMAAEGKRDGSVKRGIDNLTKNNRENGEWDEKYFTGTGFPGHFYIRYHGYRHYFPLMALGQYRSRA